MFLIRQINNINFGKIREIVDEVHKRIKKPKILIFFDLMWCIIFYKAGYSDYIYFEMYKLNHKNRLTILTRGKNNAYIKKLNPKIYWKFIDDKVLFNIKFKDYLHRDFMKLEDNNFEEFKDFLLKHSTIIVKPIDATCGVGVERIVVKGKSRQEEKKLFNQLLAKRQVLIEEVATQHRDMKKLHPDSINTVRIVTIHNKYNVVSIVAAVCRMGTNHNIVDNFHNGGLCAPIDISTGVIYDKAISKDGKFYSVHPTTNVSIVGFKIPNWEKIRKLVVDAAYQIPELGIIGWDVCVGEEEPSLIEANQYPAYDLYKLIKIDDDIGGMVPIFEKALHRKK